MFASNDELLTYIAAEGVEFVDVRFCDLPGVMQHFTVPASSFTAELLDTGLMFDGSSIRGFQAIHESDMALLADPTTAVLDPFRASKTINLNRGNFNVSGMFFATGSWPTGEGPEALQYGWRYSNLDVTYFQ